MSANTQLLSGRHALVTGGSRGIGVAIAQCLLDHGALVTLLGRELPGVTSAAAKLSVDRCHGAAADVSNSDQLRTAFQDATNRFGPIGYQAKHFLWRVEQSVGYVTLDIPQRKNSLPDSTRVAPSLATGPMFAHSGVIGIVAEGRQVLRSAQPIAK